MNDIQPLIDALQAKLPWIAALTSFMGLARLLAKPLSALVQSFFSKLLLHVQGTPERDDDLWVEKILASKLYRAFAFLVDWVLSVKLPTSASVQKVAENPPIAPPLGLWLVCGFLSVGLIGCVTTPTARQLTLIKTAAYNGTYFSLQEKPLWRPGFVTAEKELRAFSTSTNAVGMVDIVAIVNRLPVRELKSPHARLFVQNGVLLVETITGGSAVPAEQLATPRVIAGTLADGVALGLQE